MNVFPAPVQPSRSSRRGWCVVAALTVLVLGSLGHGVRSVQDPVVPPVVVPVVENHDLDTIAQLQGQMLALALERVVAHRHERTPGRFTQRFTPRATTSGHDL